MDYDMTDPIVIKTIQWKNKFRKDMELFHSQGFVKMYNKDGMYPVWFVLDKDNLLEFYRNKNDKKLGYFVDDGQENIHLSFRRVIWRGITPTALPELYS
jgi:hypothetical protein